MNDQLRGDAYALQQDLEREPKGLRPDGTRQGPGYFGTLFMEDDADLVCRELATPVFDVAGHMSLVIPLLVPTLSLQEIAHLVVGGDRTWGIIEKAKRHAVARLTAKRSVYAEPGEQRLLPNA